MRWQIVSTPLGEFALIDTTTGEVAATGSHEAITIARSIKQYLHP